MVLIIVLSLLFSIRAGQPEATPAQLLSMYSLAIVVRMRRRSRKPMTLLSITMMLGIKWYKKVREKNQSKN
jgi:hypothetical protein